MPIDSLYVPSVTDNATDPEKIPKVDAQPELVVADHTHTESQLARHALKSMAGIVVCAALTTAEFGILLSWERYTIVHVAVFWLVIVTTVRQAATARASHPNPGVVEVSHFTLLAVIGSLGLVTGLHFLGLLECIFPLWCMVMIYQCVSLRRHAIQRASIGMLDRETVTRFRLWKKLPGSLSPASTLSGIRSAIACYLSYGQEPAKSPGTFKSPAGGYYFRQSLSYLSLTLAAMCVFRYLAPGVLEWIKRGLNQIGWESPLVTAVVWIIVSSLSGLGVWLAAMSVSVVGFAGKALALKRKQISSRHWRRMMDRLEESENKIERKSIWIGWANKDWAPILWPISKLFQHSWVCGSTGSGKTSWLLGAILDQVIYRKGDIQVVVIDLKSHSYEMLASMRRAAHARRKKTGDKSTIKYFTLNQGAATYLLDIFSQSWWKRLPTPQRTGVVLSVLSLEYSRAYGESYYSDSASTLLSFVLERHPGIRSWRELLFRMKDAIRSAKPYELSESVKRDGEHIALVIARIASLSPLNDDGQHPTPVRDNAIDFSSGHYYFSLCAADNGMVAGEVGRLIVGSVLGAARAMPGRKTILVIDEWQELVTRELERLLSQARSLGVGVVLSNQYAGQLDTKDMDLRTTVEASTSLQAWMKVTDTLGREQLRRLGGEQIVPMISYRREEGQTPKISVQEKVQDRVPGTLVSRISSDPQQFFVRLTDNEGYAQTHDLIFAARSMFHQTKKQYEQARSMPWPVLNSQTLINQHQVPQYSKTTKRSATIGP